MSRIPERFSRVLIYWNRIESLLIRDIVLTIKQKETTKPNTVKTLERGNKQMFYKIHFHVCLILTFIFFNQGSYS